MKRFQYWTVSAGQDTDEPSRSPELFVQITRPAASESTRSPVSLGSPRFSPNIKRLGTYLGA
ncbi:hypothetical protein CROQUDRAFT_659962 [Cronartium quercuum f. sp. fusiforme G11]|uniref:Uncharacterized protein n=1 Tax=Cronartium quercuum f. sp. fusiforme G11 TaxID=708437 RepID=A0A9P6NEK1_9BASI|nr:hypothetical protein CROQUDRAFT_659962 [Cronartium quercuum f. sp. fusiforme G11]